MKFKSRGAILPRMERDGGETRHDKGHHTLLHDLGERIKELTLLHRTARLLGDDTRSIEDILRELVELVPPGWQYPEVTAACIRLGSLNLPTSRFVPSPWSQKATFTTADGTTGEVTVIYTEARPPEAEGPFLAEERALLASVADMLRTALDRRRALHELRAANAALEERVAERTAALQEKNRALELFSSSVAHDLKAPLRGIDGYSRILLEEHSHGLDEEGQRLLQALRASTERMKQLINGLLAYSRLEMRILAVSSIAVRPFLDALLAERRADLAESGITPTLDLQSERIDGDREAIGQALRNYLDNAIKFTRGRSEPRVEIGAALGGATVRHRAFDAAHPRSARRNGRQHRRCAAGDCGGRRVSSRSYRALRRGAGANDPLLGVVGARRLRRLDARRVGAGRGLADNSSRERGAGRQVERGSGIVGESLGMARVLELVRAVARTRATVLVHGESGVGKELVARAIHAESDRAAGPLVKVNCASIPQELFESEFFGHMRGSFTGAHQNRLGRFELAHGGTLFLDEAGEIPLELQAKFLRVLQDSEFERVGDDRTRRVDVRIVAATNRDLAAEVKAGRFRRDLYYRLSVFPIEVPPLRARREDIVPLAEHFLAQSSRALGRAPRYSPFDAARSNEGPRHSEAGVARTALFCGRLVRVYAAATLIPS